MQVTFTCQKLITQFNVKDRTKFEHKHYVIYFSTCPVQNCSDNYLGESARRISERIIGHGGRDKKSHLFQHAVMSIVVPVMVTLKLLEMASETTRLKESLLKLY